MMMTQGRLNFQYESEKNEESLTSFAGIWPYLELILKTGLYKSIQDTLQTSQQGWSDQQHIISCMFLNLLGGESVTDIERLELDEGLKTLYREFENNGMRIQHKRAYQKRWRKPRTRVFPSVSSLRRFLARFHDEDEERLREDGVAFIPKPNKALSGLMDLNDGLIQFAQRISPQTSATLDMDATLSQTHKRQALFSYKKYKAYQPVNVYWHEQGMILRSEFRDGNVPAKFDLLRVLQESLEKLPKGVEEVFLRSDSAGYLEDLLSYCAEGKDTRFKQIKFSVSALVSQGFKQAILELEDSAWRTVTRVYKDGKVFKTEQEWAEVCFVPDWCCKKKSTPRYRFIAIREKLAPLKASQSASDLPFPSVEVGGQRYKMTGIITNRSLEGSALIQWHRERCGDSERIHHTQKNELTGGRFPSGLFGANAAWWHIMILALNINQLMKRQVLPKHLRPKSLKTLRFLMIHIAGRVIRHSRRWVIRVSGGHQTRSLFVEMRRLIHQLEPFFKRR